MFDIIELIWEYQMLLWKSESLGVALLDDERGRLIGLGKLLEARDPGAARNGRRSARVRLRGPVQYTVPGGFAAGELCDVGGGGLSMTVRRALGVGVRTLIRLVDPVGGCEYTFPARVVWAASGRRPVLGLVFDGVPLRTIFNAQPLGAWRADLRLGESADLPISA